MRILREQATNLLDIHGDLLLLDWLEIDFNLGVFEGSSFFDESRREFAEHGPEKMNTGLTSRGDKTGRLPATTAIEAMAQASATALMLKLGQTEVPLIAKVVVTIRLGISPGELRITGEIRRVRGALAQIDVRCHQKSREVIGGQLLYGGVVP